MLTGRLLVLWRLFELEGLTIHREVYKLILVRSLHVNHVAGLHVDVPQRDVVAARERHVWAVARLEELRPGLDEEEASALARDVLHRHVLIVLGRVRTHLQPQHAVGIVRMAVAQDDVTVVYGLRAQRQTAMHQSVVAVLNQDALTGTVRGVLVGPRTLAALQHYGIVIDMHVAAVECSP